MNDIMMNEEELDLVAGGVSGSPDIVNPGLLPVTEEPLNSKGPFKLPEPQTQEVFFSFWK